MVINEIGGERPKPKSKMGKRNCNSVENMSFMLGRNTKQGSGEDNDHIGELQLETGHTHNTHRQTTEEDDQITFMTAMNQEEEEEIFPARRKLGLSCYISK